MEAAPLTLAHTHARNAVLETRRNNPVAASEEHDLAAAEFASAAQGSSDQEAVRILNLLEHHHKKLGYILRYRHEQQTITHVNTAVADETVKEEQALARKPSSEAVMQPPRLPRTTRSSARERSTSIASNLATARGIPNPRHKKPTPISPTLTNQHADGRFTQDDTRQKSSTQKPSGSPTAVQDASRPSWAPPLSTTNDPLPTSTAHPQSSDAPFHQFYSTFESLVSKLSAPLAFTGLPLPNKSSSQDKPAPPQTKTSKPPNAPDATPSDYSQLISRAALRAVHSNNSNPSAFNPSESFYVVPTTGGTISYADIMSRADREEARTLRHHQRHTSNLSNISEDSFVDARSTTLPQRRGITNEKKVAGKTMEELALENQALKHLSDTLSKRLHLFEMSSQVSAQAMAQSIRSMPRSPLMTPEHSNNNRLSQKSRADPPSVSNQNSDNDILRKKLEEMEAQARKREQENEKLRMTLGKYKDKWDTLKAGAKERRAREVQGQARGTEDRARHGRREREETIAEVPES